MKQQQAAITEPTVSPEEKIAPPVDLDDARDTIINSMSADDRQTKAEYQAASKRHRARAATGAEPPTALFATRNTVTCWMEI
jgi:hypothetical protein